MNIALLDDEMHENENLRAMIKVYAFDRNYDIKAPRLIQFNYSSAGFAA